MMRKQSPQFLFLLQLLLPISASGWSSSSGASLAIVFDTTGSMKDDLVGVKRGVTRILQEPDSRRGTAVSNYILVRVNEPVVSQPQVTNDPEEFQEMIEDIFVQGGGDCPEATLQGIKLALEAAQPRSFIYVFTDASAKDPELLDSVLELIQRKESQVVFVLTGDCGDENSAAFQCYQRISQASSGILIRIMKNRVLDIMNLVKVALTPERVHILSVDKEIPDENNIYDIPIDSTVKYFTVSVSGRGVRIESLQDPFGRQVNPAYNASLPNVEVKSVSNPILGHWTLRVTPPKTDSNGKAKHSIRVTGRSKLDFSHAFSTSLGNAYPVEIASNSTRPYLGIPSHLYINQTRSLGTVHNAALTTFEKYSLITARARQLSESVFVTDRLEPPSGFFYVVVTGKDLEGRDYQRYSPTAVKALVAPAPRVECRSLDVRVRRGDWTSLRCEVFSTKDYLTTWYKVLGENRKQVLQSISSPAGQRLQTLTLKEADATVAGVYELMATTVDGQMHSDRVQVTVLPDPPTVLVAPNNVSVAANTVAKLRCLVVAEASAMTSLVVDWSRAGSRFDVARPLVNSSRIAVIESRQVSAVDKTLIIRYATESDSGEYVCRAAYTTSGSSSGISGLKSTWLIVSNMPIVLRLLPDVRRLNYRRNDTIRIECQVESGQRGVQLNWWRMSTGQLVSTTGILQIARAEPQHAGVFQCRPETASRNASFKSVELVYGEPPAVQAVPANLMAYYGTNASLYCAITAGVPKPRLVWQRLSTPTTASNVTVVESGGLRIHFLATETTVGEWVCLAKNEAGTAEAKVQVSIVPFIKIDATPSPVLVKLSRPVEIECRIRGQPRPTIVWTKDGEAFIADASIDQDGQRLRISRAQVRHSGNYRCTAENSLGSMSKVINLVVGQAPKPVKPLVGPNKLVLYEGEARELHCNATGIPNPIIQWRHNGSVRSSSGSVLNIRTVTVSSAGRYNCSASNQFGTTTILFDVSVVSKPVIVPPTGLVNSKKLVKLNDSLLLECRLFDSVRSDLDASLEVIWLKDGDPIDGRVIDVVQNSDGTKSLLIRRASLADSGKYMCIASNKAGSDSILIDVSVIYSPHATSSQVQVLRRSAGQDVSISCNVTDGVPPAVFTWRMNPAVSSARSSSIGSPDSSSRIKLSTDRKVLTIKRLVASDSGSYDCTATNRVGSATSRTRLIVSDPPVIDRSKLGPVERWVLRNRGASLTCPIGSGSPRPSLTWFLNGRRLDTADSSNGFILRRNGEELEILSAQPEHQGRYRCGAANPSGIDAIELVLSVVEAPILRQSPDEIRAKSGDPVSIWCRVLNGTRPIDLSWTRGDSPIIESSRVRMEANGERLVIQSAQTSDSGRYKCTARNRFGLDSRSFVLDIESPPLRFVNQRIGIYVVVKAIENQSVSLDCSLEPQRTQPEYLWVRHGHGPIVGGSAVSADSSRLNLNNVTPEQAGNYTCTARSGDRWLRRYFKLVVNSPPRLREGPDDVNITVNAKEFVSLQCTADGVLRSTIQWFKDGIPVEILIASGVGYLITDVGAGGSNLLIPSAQLNDAGIFTCRARNSAGSVSKRHYLVLQSGPSFPSDFNTSRELRQVNLQDFVELSCPVRGGRPTASIVWSRQLPDGTRQDLSSSNVDSSRFSVLDNGQKLLIFSVALTDSGVYTCTARSIVGQINKVYNLQVRQRPKILDGQPKTVTSIEGDSDVRLPCSFEASPEPTVRWSKAGQSLESAGRFKLLREYLEISSVTGADSGEYTCLVTNSAGQDVTRVQLRVLVKPRIAGGPFPRTVVAKRGQSVKLNCSAIGDPQPSIVWKRGTDDVIVPSSTFQLSGSSLIINNLDPSHAGMFTCEASNTAGTAAARIELQILLAPVIQPPSTSVHRVPAGEAVLLECRAVGDPQPLVTWSRNGSQIYWNNPLYRLLSSGSLRIPNAQSNDAGMFRCTARNSAGKAVQDHWLEVIDRPTVVAAAPVVTVTLEPGASPDATLRCEVRSGAAANLSWRRNDAQLQTSSSRLYQQSSTGPGGVVTMSLTIRQVRVDDAGQYRCLASNGAGADSAEVLLRTLVPPSVADNQVEVAGPPEVSHAAAPNYQFFMNGWMQLRCQASGRPPARIFWYRNGRRISSETPAATGSGSHSVYRLGPGDTGLYECEAENLAGRKRKIVANVTVLGPPEVLSLGHSTDLSGVYPAVTLTCQIQGSFTQLDWTLNGQPLQTSAGSRFSDYGNGTLVIRRATSADAGRYTCIARNPSGSGRAEASVPAPPDGRPRFLDDDAGPTELSAPAGQPLRLRCPGRPVGRPTPRVYWLKDGRPLPTSSTGAQPRRQLQLLLVSPEPVADSGVYRCVAENSIGGYAESSSIRLRIFVNGGFSAWSDWSPCSVTCGPGGWTRRSRRCDSPAPMNGGADCVGLSEESRGCWERDCVVRRTCAQFGHTCQAGCQNTPTGFRCTCPRGYSLDEATGRRCQDVDECLATSRPPPCPAFEQCLNTIGSYHCRTIQCPAGYVYDSRQRVCLEPCRPEDRNCNSTNGNSLKFIVINVLPKHNNFTLKIIDARHVNVRNCHYRLLQKSADAPFDIRSSSGRVTIIRTPDPDLAGKLGRMFQMKIKAECYRGGDKPIFRTTFNVYISIAAYNYGMPTLQFLFPRFN